MNLLGLWWRFRRAIRNPWCRAGLHRWSLCTRGCHAVCSDCAYMERTSDPGRSISLDDVFSDHRDLMIREAAHRYVPMDLR